MLDSVIEFPNIGIALDVNRVAFTLPGGVGIYWYGIIMCTAIVLGILYAIKSAKKVGILPDTVFDATFWGVILGVIGARAYFVIFAERSYTLQEAIFGLRDGGLAFYGGVIGALLGAVIAMRAKKLPLTPLSDLMGVGFLLGLTIGRWGNFVNQEAFGAATAGNLPWGMTGGRIMHNLPHEIATTVQPLGDELVHPCFLYESLWCFVGFIFLHFYSKKLQSFDGEIFLLFAVWYGTGRAFIESLRMDSLMVGDVRVSQIVSIAIASISLCAFIALKAKTYPKRETQTYIRYKDTDENKKLLANYELKTKIEREKEKGKNAFAKELRKIHDPFTDD
ncbi:MAG: prolipoprotein diacylglyceryl transferase [Oscillospiraceae bacterium]|nr:prolipoprotein diacylglyceryl transferase [Oscillospiraceae bacterium]